MNCWEFLIVLVVAGVCGSIAKAIAGTSRSGCLVSIALGFIGALIGVWLQKLTGAPELLTIRVGESQFPIVWSIIGAALFAAVVGFLTRRPNDYPPRR